MSFVIDNDRRKRAYLIVTGKVKQLKENRFDKIKGVKKGLFIIN